MTRTPAAPASRSGRPVRAPGLLRALGIAGWGALEPAILAALATESPILLIGPHGTAKTLLLQRLAEALGLAFRHYNASILSFDDLLGYPVPQAGASVYLQTPATIWEAEAVLFDEVSRCRPELQNKLFPLVHERVGPGPAPHAAAAPLGRDEPAARRSWPRRAASPTTGPSRSTWPSPTDSRSSSRSPSSASSADDDRRAVLLGGGRPQPDASDRLRGAVERCRAPLAEAEDRPARASGRVRGRSRRRSSRPRATRSRPAAR